jgi:hypothetical protein
MSVTSVQSGIPAPYSPLSGNSPQSAEFGAVAGQLRPKTPAKADGSYAGPNDVGQLQNSLEQALRAGKVAAARSASGSPGSGGGKASTGTALYQLVSRMGNNDPSTSALLSSWNSIMHTDDPAAPESGGSVHVTA